VYLVPVIDEAEMGCPTPPNYGEIMQFAFAENGEMPVP
jgi:hypothetical protein